MIEQEFISAIVSNEDIAILVEIPRAVSLDVQRGRLRLTEGVVIPMLFRKNSGFEDLNIPINNILAPLEVFGVCGVN